MANGGGISITQVAGGALEVATVVKELTAPPLKPPQADGPFRPPQWSQDPLTSITDSNGNLYVFDAVIRAEHQRGVRKTEHPVQSGANISDHAYVLPARVTLEIGMSDAMDSFQAAMWTGNAVSKSVDAYQTLIAMRDARQPVTLTTRLDTYSNMLVEDVQASDTNKTRFGLRALVTFGEIFTAEVQAVPATSARPQITDSTNQGVVQPIQVPRAISSQHSVAPQGPIVLNGGQGGGSSTQVFTGTNTGYVPNAGNWSSGKTQQ